MLQPIFTSLRRLFVPQFMRDIDQYLLTHHAWVWETRVHWFTLYATALMLLLVGAGCCVPISFPDDITTVKEIQGTISMICFLVLLVFMSFLTLMVNGLFQRFFKIGFVAINQKTKASDFFKLIGIYSFMVVLGMLVCGAFHYTIFIRTHYVMRKVENVRLLNKYVRLYEFYQQDTLSIEGFEDMKPYIYPIDLGFYRIVNEQRYYHDTTLRNSTFTVNKNIQSAAIRYINRAPVNKALYDILPTKIEYNKGTTSLSLINEYHNTDGRFANNIRYTKLSQKQMMEKGQLGIDLDVLKYNIDDYCRFNSFSFPHIDISVYCVPITVDSSKVYITKIKEKNNMVHYSALCLYNDFWEGECNKIAIISLLMVIFLLSLHAYSSYRFFCLLPFAVLLSSLFIRGMGNANGNNSIFLGQSIFIFYILFMFFITRNHRDYYIKSPLRVAAIYAISGIIFGVIYARVMGSFHGSDIGISSVQYFWIKNRNFLIPFIGLFHVGLYVFLCYFRNTRFVIATPFVYLMAFMWLIMQEFSETYLDPTIKSDFKPNAVLTFFYEQSLAFFILFLLLNLLTAPFLLSAIVRQTQQPK